MPPAPITQAAAMTAFRAMRGHHATYEQAPLPIGVTLVAMMMVLILAFFAVAPDKEPRLGAVRILM